MGNRRLPNIPTGESPGSPAARVLFDCCMRGGPVAAWVVTGTTPSPGFASGCRHNEPLTHWAPRTRGPSHTMTLAHQAPRWPSRTAGPAQRPRDAVADGVTAREVSGCMGAVLARAAPALTLTNQGLTAATSLLSLSVYCRVSAPRRLPHPAGHVCQQPILHLPEAPPKENSPGQSERAGR